ncbi:phosphoribosyltransferase [Actinomyces gaoshouyii]|uniref:phosphoribosyltransferase n=1 Tax=Actinomyces gaoshouyii TaxID=1960083 RepID=UPI0009BC9CDC|nr:phosphoribosyltransferase [Actinomyces gaoshouyii]ARD42508.1 hypothetical protein B6G06_09275 [Actinomyces gaoshouyii]
MTARLPDYYWATTVPEQMRARQCTLCRTPVDEGYRFCFRCHEQATAHPDLAGFVTYAVRGRQPGAEMYRYKNQPPSHQAIGNVLLLLEHGLSHMSCAEHLVGSPVSAVAVVPSRSRYQAGVPSMLQRMCTRTLHDNMPLVDIRPTPGSTSDRCVHGDAFDVITPPHASHVMLIDDTWVSGATTLSAVAALRASDAHHVSTLVLARWLDPGYGPTNSFLTTMQQYAWHNPQDVCPFTPDGTCPR